MSHPIMPQKQLWCNTKWHWYFCLPIFKSVYSSVYKSADERCNATVVHYKLLPPASPYYSKTKESTRTGGEKMQILEFSNKLKKRANTTWSSLGFMRSSSNRLFLWTFPLSLMSEDLMSNLHNTRSTYIRWRWGLTFFFRTSFWSHPCWRDWPVLIF